MRGVLILHDLDAHSSTMLESPSARITALQRKFLRTKRQVLYLSNHISGLRPMHMHIFQLARNLSNRSSITITS